MSSARLVAPAAGALWGTAVAGFLASAVGIGPVTALSLGAVVGFWVGVRRRRTAVTAPLWLPAAAAACATVFAYWPEPVFFVLVPLLAAGIAPPLGRAAAGERLLPRGAVVATMVLAASVFFVASASRHWAFASGAKDLGLFYQTHWLVAHGLTPFNSVMGMHVLADHMELIDVLVAPLLRVYEGPETLLFVQAAVVASGVFPIVALGRRLLGRGDWALAVAWLWLLAPDVHSGILFDYNPSTLGATLLLWLAWALVCRGLVASVITALLACACKENFCIYVAVLALVLALRGVPRSRALVVAGLAACLFVVEMQGIAPWFREEGFRHWDFESLGQGPAEIVASLVHRPDKAARLLVDHPQKRRGLLQPLLTTGYLGLLDPAMWLLQLPNWGERFLSSHRTRWWGYYYGMPAVATAIIGLLFGVRRLVERGRAGDGLPRYVLVCALLTGLLPPYRTHDGDGRSMLYYWRRPYASAPEDVRTQRHAVAFIGADPRRRVAAQYHLLPHLAGRPFIVTLENAAQADFVALQIDGGTSPEGRGAWRRRVQGLWDSGAYDVGFCEGRSLVLVRKGYGAGVPCPAWDALMADRRPATASPSS